MKPRPRPTPLADGEQIRRTLKAELGKRDKRNEAIIGAVTASLRQQLLVKDAPSLVNDLIRAVPAVTKRQAFIEVAEALGLSDEHLRHLYYEGA